MTNELRSFARVRPALPEGWPLYEAKCDEPLYFYILFVVARQFDWFTVELAWNRTPGFPFHLLSGRPEDFDAASTRFRLPELWGQRSDELYWFGAELTVERMNVYFEKRSFLQGERLEPKLADVGPKVDNALGKIRQFAVPYFRKVAQLNKCSFPT
jgi:hypothetical protein